MTNETGTGAFPPIEWPIEWKEFLESQSPGKIRSVTGVARKPPQGAMLLETPVIRLYCDSGDCEDQCFFKCTSGTRPIGGTWEHIFLQYQCRNCETTRKIFAVRARVSGNSSNGEAAKLGEWPPFGPHIPSKVITLIRDDKDLFIKGRRAESQGLGIGAYAYYRRVVENQRNRLMDEIIKVAERTNAGSEVLATLQAARKETQFNKAVDLIKDGVPASLKIDGHNPLQLLHAAISRGIHELTDQECLEKATTVRLVLTDLAERISQALKEHKELQEGIARLLRPPESKGTTGDAGQGS